MKLILVTNNFPPVVDGVGDYSYELYTRLQKLGHEVKVVTSQKQEIINGFAKGGNSVFPIIRRWTLGSHLTIAKLIRKEQAKWLCLQYVPYAYSKKGIPFHLIFLAMLCRFNGCKLLVCFHEVAVRTSGEGARSALIGYMQRMIAYALCLFSNSRITSINLYATYLKPFRASISPIPANLYLGSDELFVEKKTVKESLTITSFANRVDRHLLEAIEQLRKTVDIPFKIVAAGYCNEKLQRHIESMATKLKLGNILELTGKLSKEAMAQLLLETDIYVQTEFVGSKQEGGISAKSGAVAAAMCAGAAIVTTKGDMTDEAVFVEHYNIVFIDYLNTGSIFSVIEELCINNELRNQLKYNARSTYEKQMAWKCTISLYQQIFNEDSQQFADCSKVI